MMGVNKMKKHLQNGFAHLGFLLLVLAVAAISFASYKVVKDRQVKSDASQTSTAVTKTSAQPINNTADLDSTTSDLNSQSVDSDLNPDQLNGDVTSLLW